MRCPACRAENSIDAATCAECGEDLPSQVKKPAKKIPIARAQPDEVEDVVPVVKPKRRPRVQEEDEDDDDYNPGDGGIGTLIPYRNPKALIAYYMGFISLIPAIGLLTAPVAIVLGILGVRKARAEPLAKGSVHAWIGIVFGIISLLCNIPFVSLMGYGAWTSARH